ncbi:MAG: O-antigen ligase family protein [Cyanobacteria bacterium P01_D01_bin.6]
MIPIFYFWGLMLASTLGRLKILGLPVGIGYPIILLMSVGLFIYHSRAYYLEFRKHHQAVIIAVALLAFSLLSTLLSSDITVALRYYVRLIFYILIFFDFLCILSIQAKDNKQHHIYLKKCLIPKPKIPFLDAWVGFLFVLSLLGMVELFFPGAWIFTLKYPSFHPRIGSIVQSPNIFGTLMVLGVVNAFYILKIAFNKSAVKLIWLVISLFLISIVLSGSRTALLLLLLAAAAYDRTGKSQLLRRSKIIIPAVFVMLLIMIFSRYPELVTGKFTEFYKAASYFSTSATSRIEIWQVAIQEFLKAPLVGQGLGIFPEVIGPRVLGWNGSHTHNFFLEFAVSLGCTGIILSVILIYQVLTVLPKISKVVAYSLVIILMSQIVDFYFYDLTFAASSMYILALANFLAKG